MHQLFIEDMTKEMWVPVRIRGELIERYEASSWGRVYDNHLEKYIDGFRDRDDYLIVNMRFNDKRKCFKKHRVILESFSPESDYSRLVVNHINHTRDDNRLCNLEWLTAQDNTKWAAKHKRMWSCRGTESNFNKYSEEKIIEVLELLQDGKHTRKRISEITGISKDYLHYIIYGRAWAHLSKDYNLSHMRNKYARKLSVDDELTVVAHHDAGLSTREICEAMGLTENIKRRMDSVRRILKKYDRKV